MREDRRARGVVHIHTEFSFDGCLAPARIAEMCRQRGLRFAAITDHAESMDEDSMARLISACEENSDSEFVMIPGLEHRFRHGVHVLALGQSRLVSASSTIDMLAALANDGCVLIAAHCVTSRDLPIELLEILTAVEIWNVTRDTRLLPTSRYVPVYRQLAAYHPSLYAIGGLDMHKGNEWACEVSLAPSFEAKPDAVLAKLKGGQFATRSRLFSFGSRPAAGVRNLAFVAGDAFAALRDFRDRL